ncbi:MAG: carboxypeptidase regulatory-like domain-containing protein [Planctomycetes bacterium]|nr:carboxypeptidase regulatory-like domain-containing protein [Planctomycetota bacterium]
MVSVAALLAVLVALLSGSGPAVPQPPLPSPGSADPNGAPPAGPATGERAADAGFRTPAEPEVPAGLAPIEVEVLVCCEGLDGRDQPTAAPFVAVALQVDDEPWRSGTTDRTGLVRFPVPATGRAAVARCSLGAEAMVTLAGSPTRIELRVVPRLVVRGMVVDSRGRGVAGATLQVLPWGEGDTAVVLDAGLSQPDGSFVVGLQQGGRFGASHPGHAPSPFYLVRPASTGGPATRTLQLRLGEQTASLHGLVVDALGKPVGNAEIELQSRAPTPKDADLPAPPRRLVSDARGSFSASDLPPGPLRFGVRKLGLGRGQGLLELAAGERLAVRLVLPPSCRIAGTTHDADGRPLANAIVSVGSPRAFPLLQTTSDAEGRFVLDGVAPGTEPVQAQWRKDGTTLLAEASLEVRVGESTAWHAVLRAPADQDLLVGVLVDPAGRPLAHWRVAAHHRGASTAPVETDAMGVFRLSLPAGRQVDLRAFAEGRPSRAFADAVLRAVDSSRTDVQFVVEPVPFTRGRGRLVTALGAGLAGEARCWHRERGEQVTFPSLADGTLVLADLPPGTLDFEFHSPGHTRVVRHGVVVRLGLELDLGSIALELGASLRGAIRGFDGAPVQDAQVRVVAADADFVADWNGVDYVFAALPAGRHRLQVQATGHAAAVFEVVLQAGQAIQRDIELLAGVRRTVRVHVPPGVSGTVSLAFQPPGLPLQWQAHRAVPAASRDPQVLEFEAWLAPGDYEGIAWCGTGLGAKDRIPFAATATQPVDLRLIAR